MIFLRADRDYSDVNKQQQANALLLEEIMLKHGFISIYYEWWHFADEKRDSFPVVEEEELLADKTGRCLFQQTVLSVLGDWTWLSIRAGWAMGNPGTDVYPCQTDQ